MTEEAPRIAPERPEYYDAWLKTFGQVREISLALQTHHYHIRKPVNGRPTIAQIKAACTDTQWSRLMDHALCLACLDGNAFPDLVEQYVPEAWVNLMWNGWTGSEKFPAVEGFSRDD